MGSTGIQSFIDSLRILGQSSAVGTRLVGLKPEFKRIFSNLEIQGLEIHESENEAILSFTAPRPVALVAAAMPQSPLAELDLDPEVGE